MKIKNLLLLSLSVSLLVGCDIAGGFFNPENSNGIYPSVPVSSNPEQTIENNIVKIETIRVNEMNNNSMIAEYAEFVNPQIRCMATKFHLSHKKSLPTL